MKPLRIAIMYGSQTGNAQSIAEGLHEGCKTKGIENSLLKCDSWKKMTPELKDWSVAVFVVSTTGNGDPPENAERFWRFLKRRAHPKDLLAGLPFALLGLGDTNYDKFCYMGKSLDKRLRELGAVPFHAPAFADEATNMEETIEPWTKSLYQSLEALRDGEIGGAQAQAQGLPDQIPPPQESTTTGSPIAPGDSAAVPKGNGAVPRSAEPLSVTSAAAKGDGVSATAVEASTSKASIADANRDASARVEGEMREPQGAGTKEPLPEHRIAVMYGSQTGNAHSIAERVHEDCKKRGFNATLLACDGWKKMTPELKEWTALVLVVSTTGNGDPPENAERFWRFLKRRSQPKDLLQGVPFALLGLGDTNYDKFCHMGKSLDKRLRELGAVPFHSPAFADEATNMEETVEPWTKSLFPAIESLVTSGATEAPEATSAAGDANVGVESARVADVPSTGVKAATGAVTGHAEAGVPAAVVDEVVAELSSEVAIVDGCEGADNGASVGKGKTDVDPAEEVIKLIAAAATVEPEVAATNLAPEALAGLGLSESTAVSDDGVQQNGNTLEGVVAPVWSPSVDSGARLLSCFLSAEHLEPDYACPRHELPSLRATAPDLQFSNVKSVCMDGEGDGKGARLGDRRRSTSTESGHTCDRPFEARVLEARYLTEGGRKAERRVILMELSLEGSGISYEPGDVIGVRCPNPVKATAYILERLQDSLSPGTGPDVPFHHSLVSIPYSPCTLREAFSTWVDLQAPLRRPMLRALAEFCQDPRERAWMELLCAKVSGADVYRKYVAAQSLTLCELLEAFPSCKPRPGSLLALLPALPPRYYSVASSQLATPGSLTVAFSVVSHHLPIDGLEKNPEIMSVNVGDSDSGARGDSPSADSFLTRRGLCTSWLEDRVLTPFLSPGVGGGGGGSDAPVVPVFVKPTKEFLLPASVKWPCVLIGPGTGVSPFIGFLKHREQQLARRRENLDAVCSGYWRGGYEISLEGEEDEDWIFRGEMEAFLASRTLSQLSTAFSRDSAEKVYVQDRIREAGVDLSRLMLEERAYVYVCGDGNAMAQGVHRALVEVLVEHGGVGGEQGAERALRGMKERNRYVLDVWS